MQSTHGPAPAPAPAEDPATKRWNNLVVRTRWAAILVAAFAAVIAAGHAYIMALVLLIQVLSFREITHIGYAPSALKRLPWTRTTKWYVRTAGPAPSAVPASTDADEDGQRARTMTRMASERGR